MNPGYKTNITEAMVEQMAREMIISGRGDPCMRVFKGEPRAFATPIGTVFLAPPEAPVELWTLHVGIARRALEVAQRVVEDSLGTLTFSSETDMVTVTKKTA